MRRIEKVMRQCSGRASHLLLGICLLFFAGCASVAPSVQNEEEQRHNSVEQRVKRIRETHEQVNAELFFLEFDHRGKLSTPTELARAVSHITQSFKTESPLTNVLILSYGWSYNRTKDESTYAAFVRDYAESVYGTNTPPGKWAVICVGWESDHSGFATLTHEWIPGDFVSEKLAAPLDYAAFPLSVWSKAALADRIGHGELKESISYLYKETFAKEGQRARIFLVGHSFGCRVLSGLLKNNTGEFWSKTIKAVARRVEETTGILHTRKRPVFREHIAPLTPPFVLDVQGALFIQPALSEFDLPGEQDHADYPIIVTQTRNDRLNGALFPISSVPLNASMSGGYEQVSLYLGRGSDLKSKTLHELHDFFRIPYTVTISALAFPFSYAWAQGREILDRGPLYVLDTLAQVPVAEALVYYTTGIDGQRKGALTFGPLHESAGRIATQSAASTLTAFAEADQPAAFTNGPTYLNADEEIRHGILWKEDLGKNAVDFTIGWFDPLGAHSTYDYARNEADRKLTYHVLHKLLHGQVTLTNNPAQRMGLQRTIWEYIHRRQEAPEAQQEAQTESSPKPDAP